MHRGLFRSFAAGALLIAVLAGCARQAPPLLLSDASTGTPVPGGCTYADQADVEAALGKAVDAGAMVDIDGTRLCTFAAADKTPAGVQIRVSKRIGAVAPQDAVAASRKLTRDSELLEGLGDAAVLLRFTDQTRVVLYKGDQEIVVTLLKPAVADADDLAEALATKVAGHITQ